MTESLEVKIVTGRALLRDALARLASGFPEMTALAVAPAALIGPPPDVLVVDHESAILLDTSARSGTIVLLGDDARCNQVASELGAAGCVDMDATPDRLRRALLQAHRDGRISAPVPESTKARPRDRLSTREREVLIGLAAGKRGSEIGREMGVSPHTVRTHVQNLMSKLGVSSRVEAVIVARKLGLLDGREADQKRESES